MKQEQIEIPLFQIIVLLIFWTIVNLAILNWLAVKYETFNIFIWNKWNMVPELVDSPHTRNMPVREIKLKYKGPKRAWRTDIQTAFFKNNFECVWILKYFFSEYYPLCFSSTFTPQFGCIRLCFDYRTRR